MKNSIRLLIAFLSLAVISCTDDVEDRTAVSENTAPVLKTPSSVDIALSNTSPNDPAVTIVWDHAAYNGTQTVINYSIEFDEAGNDFATPTVVATTTDKFKSFSVGELNAAALDAGIAPFVASAVEVRIKATVGSLGALAQTSNPITLNMTPYPAWPNWGIIGSATPTGWGSDTNMDYDLTTRLYSITMPLIGGQFFKFRLDDGWSVNFGDNGNDLSLEANGGDIPVAVDGTYTIVANFSDSTVGGMPPTSYTITLN
ncbi:MAG: SusE domain-containing protein [Bacteroidota bacterium]